MFFYFNCVPHIFILFTEIKAIYCIRNCADALNKILSKREYVLRNVKYMNYLACN